MSEPKTYIIKNISDFFNVPDDRLAVCLRDFANNFPAQKRFIALQKDFIAVQRCEFVWIDDGKDDVIYHLVVNPGENKND